MTGIGDTITTVEELDALPVGAIVLARGVALARQVSNAVRWIYTTGSGGYSNTADLLLMAGRGEDRRVTLAYLPGQPPRPERVVKAEALREALEAIRLGGQLSLSDLEALMGLANRAAAIERGDLP